MNRKKIWLILGPALFALSFIPYGGLTQNVRLALGTVLWMGVWWVAMPVPPAITAFLPVVINAVFALTDMSSITNCYSAELVFLLAGADIITMVWEITGVDKRIAAHSLALVGTSVRQQVVIWFLISTVLSAVLPNTVVAAVLCSIAMAMLKFVGEGDVGKSSAAKLVLLAIVWGANNGGMFTPLGGAMNLITVSYIEELTGAEFLYTDWVRALWPFALAVTVLPLVYLLLLPCKKKTLEGSKTYFSDLCKSLPKLSRAGRISLIVFAAAALLAFTRQLYQRQFPALKPGFVFLIGGLIMFFLRDEEKKPIINASIEVGSTVIGLENGLVLKSPDVITIINSVSSGGEQLYLNNYRVWVNEQEIYSPCSQTGSSFGYETYLSNEGANTITISATDADGYAVKQSWTVYYEKGDVTVTISVEATTVGLGYLVPPTDVTVPGGTDLLTMVTQLLSDNGFSPSVSSNYLAAIQRPSICDGFYIDEELMELIVSDEMDDFGAGLDPQPASMDSLGEFDFYRWSGWMYSYNGRYPGYSMSACKPQDGAEIRLRFTLALGKDIGGFNADAGVYGASSGNYYREW